LSLVEGEEALRDPAVVFSTTKLANIGFAGVDFRLFPVPPVDVDVDTISSVFVANGDVLSFLVMLPTERFPLLNELPEGKEVESDCFAPEGDDTEAFGFIGGAVNVLGVVGGLDVTFRMGGLGVEGGVETDFGVEGGVDTDFGVEGGVNTDLGREIFPSPSSSLFSSS
jgi:hypothetical protein